jgi:hypothetical protein
MGTIRRWAIVGIMAVAGGLSANSLVNYLHSPERAAAIKLEQNLSCLLSNSNKYEGGSYHLLNGVDATVTAEKGYTPSEACLRIRVDNVSLESQKGHLATLDRVFVSNPERGRNLGLSEGKRDFDFQGKDKIPNYSDWQERYEKLISDCVDAEKARLEAERKKAEDVLAEAAKTISSPKEKK